MLAACSPVPPPISRAGFSHVSANHVSANFETLLNSALSSRGLRPLTRSANLTAAAQRHADDMFRGAFFSHTSSNGDTIAQRTRAQGFGFCWIAENISVGRASGAEAFDRWMASPGHRKNMLARAPTQYGLATAPGNYRVLVLGRPGC